MYVRGVSKKFGELYQKTNNTEDKNKLTLLVFKIMAILHNTLLATFIKLLETISKGLFRNRSQNRCNTFLDCCHIYKMCIFHDALQAGKQKEVHPPYSPDLVPAGVRSGEYGVQMAIILEANKVNLFVSSVLFVFWYHSPNFLDTPHI
jgi:hypothetical protein